jgi:hypothetical protein
MGHAHPVNLEQDIFGKIDSQIRIGKSIAAVADRGISQGIVEESMLGGTNEFGEPLGAEPVDEGR